jgi:tagaturonate reductase
MQDIKSLIISSSISDASAQQFAEQVIDRFRNNSIEHKWINISMQYSSKMAMRTVPLIAKHLTQNQETPKLMVLGFAAYLMFMNTTKSTDGIYYSKVGNIEYPITDEKAPLLHQYWEYGDLETVIPLILKDTSLWGIDLNSIPNFANDTIEAINNLRSQGAEIILKNLLSEKLAHA